MICRDNVPRIESKGRILRDKHQAELLHRTRGNLYGKKPGVTIVICRDENGVVVGEIVEEVDVQKDFSFVQRFGIQSLGERLGSLSVMDSQQDTLSFGKGLS